MGKKGREVAPNRYCENFTRFFLVLYPLLSDNYESLYQMCNKLTPSMSIFGALCFASVTKRAAPHLKRVTERKRTLTFHPLLCPLL